MIRDVTVDDKEWILNVCESVYSGTEFGWSRADAASSFDAVIKSPKALVIRGDKTFFYAFLEPRLCDYSKKDAYMELLVGEGNGGLEPYRLVEIAKKWCILNKINRLTISSVTEHNFGELIIKRLGAVARVVYDINL